MLFYVKSLQHFSQREQKRKRLKNAQESSISVLKHFNGSKQGDANIQQIKMQACKEALSLCDLLVNHWSNLISIFIMNDTDPGCCLSVREEKFVEGVR